MSYAAPHLFLRVAIASAVLAASIATATIARADEAEPVRLAYVAPEGCASEAQFRVYVAASGGRLRADRPGVAARTLTVRIAREKEGDRLSGRVVVEDIFGEETARSLSSDTCEEIARALALVVALALDAPPRERALPVEETPPPRTSERPQRDAESSASSSMIAESARAGAMLSGFIGGGVGRTSAGLRALGAAKVGLSHLGGVLAFESDSVTDETIGSLTIASGYSGRLGGFAAWGAPWDGDIIGFIGEAGIAAGGAKGAISPRVAPAARESSDFCPPQGCFGNASPMTARFLSPYAAATLLLQWPALRSLRPIAGISAIWTPGFYSGSTFVVSPEIGIAWLKW
jgi:hypothetical protein